MRRTTYHYYVGFVIDGPGLRAGGQDVELNRPIRGVGDVLELQDFLRQQHSHGLAVTAFSRYEQ